MSTAHRLKPRFKVGDWVDFPFGARRIWAQVIEDRGGLGADGRRIYRIRLPGETREEDEPSAVAFEVGEDGLEKAEADRGAVKDYLEKGGLVSILQSNLGGGRSQPRAWLTFDSRGGLQHTFEESRGLPGLGGARVPFFALHEYKIFGPKNDEVVDFLASFGLDRADATEVVAAIGTWP